MAKRGKIGVMEVTEWQCRVGFGEPAEVTWIDHVFRGGAYDPSAESGGLTTTVSSGYLVRLDEEVTVLAQSMEGTEPHECLHLITGCVVDIRPLKRKGKS